jgi:gluconolactonase
MGESAMRTPQNQSAQPAGTAVASPPPAIAPLIPPMHAVDLMTLQGSAIFGAQWKTREAKIVEVPAIPDAMPEFTTTYDIDPHAGESGFDDSAWPTIAPTMLAAKRGGGRVSFLWFRTRLTIPARIGAFDPSGAKAVLAICIDDYAEIWVNGELPRAAGRPSPATIQGFNMPNRLVLSDAVAPGDTFEVAVFGINGPISAAPPNTVWFREARVEFFG